MRVKKITKTKQTKLKNKNKKTKNRKYRNTPTPKPERTKLASHKWINRRPKYSSLPYIINMSFKRKNIFFSAADFRGRVKCFTSSGRAGFKGRDKVHAYSIISIGTKFFRKLSKFGVKKSFLRFNNCHRKWHALQKLIQRLKWERRLKIKFLAFFIHLKLNFNGCRQKKRTRNKPPRYPRRKKRIYITPSVEDKRERSKIKKTKREHRKAVKKWRRKQWRKNTIKYKTQPSIFVKVSSLIKNKKNDVSH